MSSYTTQYYSATTSAVPIPTPGGKDAAYGYYSPAAAAAAGGFSSSYSVSPPEGVDPSVVSSGGGTYTNPATTITKSQHQHHHDGCAGESSCCCGSSVAGSASGVDFNEYMQERFADTFDPIPLDRSLAVQAQTSGNLNAKHRELLELQAKAQARLARTRARFADGLQDAQEVRSNLEWTSKRMSSLKKKAEKKHSKEYQKARERYPSPEY
ncbi:hypothetical protein F5X96DRAFT_613183 [Biscogniauxia mediterranea]|nr:hypothetical protein F5X96DRAFT_613183 [Biscogniauxia mediterranea]